MERRRAGLLIVLLVLVTAVALPRSIGRHVIGSPVAAPIPGPPAVGDCLLDPPSSTHGVVDGQGQALYQDVRTAPCSGDRYGEVVSVLPRGLSVKPVRVADDDGVFSFDDPNRHLCTTAMAGYLDPAVSADRAAGTRVWRPDIAFESLPLRPDDLQIRSGQNWVACAVFVDGRTGSVLRYTGTLRDDVQSGATVQSGVTVQSGATVQSGLTPDVVPDCLSSRNYFVQHPVDCSDAHPLEAFGLILTHRASVTELSLAGTCAAVVASATKMPDPTAGGRLQVAAMAVHRASDGTFAPGLSIDDELGTATCVVISPDRRLNGSLRGLGNGPVPWVGG